MTDETRRILDLLAQGKITVDEADQLMRAIGAPNAEAAAPKADEAEKPVPRFICIAVHKPGKEGRRDKDVNIRVPMSIVRSGMRLGAIIPGFAGEQVTDRLRERGIDLSKLDYAQIESLLKDMGDLTINVDQGKAQVRISCE